MPHQDGKGPVKFTCYQINSMEVWYQPGVGGVGGNAEKLTIAKKILEKQMDNV